MDAYATHIPVLSAVFEARKFNKILEFGMGNNSTPLLVDRSQESVVSVEMQQQSWYEKMIDHDLSKNSKWTPILCLGAFAIFENREIMDNNYDLVFVDGHGDSRPECINHFFGKSKVIIAHDVETSSYRWNLVNIPESYKMFYFGHLNPATAVYSNDFELISYLERKLNGSESSR